MGKFLLVPLHPVASSLGPSTAGAPPHRQAQQVLGPGPAAVQASPVPESRAVACAGRPGQGQTLLQAFVNVESMDLLAPGITLGRRFTRLLRSARCSAAATAAAESSLPHCLPTCCVQRESQRRSTAGSLTLMWCRSALCGFLTCIPVFFLWWPIAMGAMTGVGHSIGHHEYEYNHYPTPQVRANTSPMLLLLAAFVMVATAGADTMTDCAGVQADLRGQHGPADGALHRLRCARGHGQAAASWCRCCRCCIHVASMQGMSSWLPCKS